MPQISRGRALAYGLVVLLVLVLGGRFALGREDDSRPDEGRSGQAAGLATETLAADEAPARVLLVHVVGAVHQPGLYRLRDGSRVADAIRRAGGARPRAVLELVNLAAPVADGQQVLVPGRGQATAAGGVSPGSAAGAPRPKVRLNSATLEELDSLPGVGPVTAQKILDYRTEHGAFQTVEELDAVSGIGPATLAELKPLVDL